MATETDTSSWDLANPKSPWQVIILACLVALVSYFVARLGWLSTVGPNLEATDQAAPSAITTAVERR